jgi:two-component system chemotaxis response regulator CheY
VTKRILTVDDSRTMRDMLKLALEQAGFDVVQADDGVHGLEVLEGETPDVIITDINMPRLDGFGFIEGVRKDERHRAVPILVLTTESDSTKKERARAAGATGWIVKPFNPTKLVDAIRRVAA